MKAVVVRQHGDASCLSVETDFEFDCEQPLPAGHVLVKNEFAGLNFIDTYFRSGLYQQDLPFVAGQEGGGVIVKVAADENVGDGWKVGDRVAYMSFGSYAQYTRVPAAKCIRLPQSSTSGSSSSSLDMKVAIACMVQGLTAHYLVTDATAGLIRPGEWCLIYSVGSGTTQWAAQMAKLQGYKVIGTTSRTKVEQVAEGSVDELIVLDTAEGKTYADYASVDVAARVKEITNGQGCKCIIDGVGASTSEISVASLATRGIWITFGNASGPVPDFKLLRLAAKSAFVTRPKLGDYTATPEELNARASQVFQWIEEKKLNVSVDRIFALDDAAEGHSYLEAGRSKGKVLFEIGK